MPSPSADPPGPQEEGDPLPVTVSGDLDLHTFRPRDLPDLLPAWFGECRDLGILTVRVIHGKGTGSLRQGVHALLPRLSSHVRTWTWPAPQAAGSWGVTLVHLNPLEAPDRN